MAADKSRRVEHGTAAMIHELRRYTILPGAMPEYLRLIADVGGPIRGNRYGRLLGFWITAFGGGNEVFHLWEHDDLDTRQRLRDELFALKPWADLVREIAPRVGEQEVRLMTACIPLAPPQAGRHAYELRFVRSRMGAAGPLAAAVASELAAQAPAAGRLVGVWNTLAGDPNEAVCLIAHEDVAARLRQGATDPQWADFMARHAAAIVRTSSSLILPAAHSPMQ